MGCNQGKTSKPTPLDAMIQNARSHNAMTLLEAPASQEKSPVTREPLTSGEVPADLVQFSVPVDDILDSSLDDVLAADESMARSQAPADLEQSAEPTEMLWPVVGERKESVDSSSWPLIAGNRVAVADMLNIAKRLEADAAVLSPTAADEQVQTMSMRKFKDMAIAEGHLSRRQESADAAAYLETVTPVMLQEGATSHSSSSRKGCHTMARKQRQECCC